MKNRSQNQLPVDEQGYNPKKEGLLLVENARSDAIKLILDKAKARRGLSGPDNRLKGAGLGFVVSIIPSFFFASSIGIGIMYLAWTTGALSTAALMASNPVGWGFAVATGIVLVATAAGAYIGSKNRSEAYRMSERIANSSGAQAALEKAKELQGTKLELTVQEMAKLHGESAKHEKILTLSQARTQHEGTIGFILGSLVGLVAGMIYSSNKTSSNIEIAEMAGKAAENKYLKENFPVDTRNNNKDLRNSLSKDVSPSHESSPLSKGASGESPSVVAKTPESKSNEPKSFVAENAARTASNKGFQKY